MDIEPRFSLKESRNGIQELDLAAAAANSVKFSRKQADFDRTFDFDLISALITLFLRLIIAIIRQRELTKISRGGGYFRKIFGQGGYTKNTPYPLFPFPGYHHCSSFVFQ